MTPLANECSVETANDFVNGFAEKIWELRLPPAVHNFFRSRRHREVCRRHRGRRRFAATAAGAAAAEKLV